MSSPIELVLDRLPSAKAKAAGCWQANCPAHDDKNPSLSISIGSDGKVLMKCHAGCEFSAICAAMGIKSQDLFGTNHNGNGAVRKHISKTYDYFDADGELLYQVLRYEPRDFRQRRPNGEGGWLWNLRGVKRILYRLPELLAADPDDTVFIVEGEKDADRLTSLGLVATTSPQGAEKWGRVDATPLHGRRVAILGDNDDPGRKHQRQVATDLDGKAAEVRIVHLEGLPKNGDVSDWLDGEYDVEDLKEVVKHCDVYEAANAAQLTDDKSLPPMHELVREHLVSLQPLWHRDNSTIFFKSLGREIKTNAFAAVATRAVVNSIARTIEGEEACPRGMNAPGWRAKYSLFKDAASMELSRLLREIPDVRLTDDKYDGGVLQGDLCTCLIRERVCRADNGNPVGVDLCSWVFGVQAGGGWQKCFGLSVFGQLTAGGELPQLAITGDWLKTELKYDSARRLAKDLRAGKLADTDHVLRCGGKNQRAWLIMPIMLEYAAGTTGDEHNAT